MILFAQSGPTVPWSDTSAWVFGLMGLLGCVWLVFAVIIQGRKLFGRTPPISDELNSRDAAAREELDKRDKALRAMIFASEKNLKERMTKLEDLYAEMQADRLRKWQELQEQISEQHSLLSYIRGIMDQQAKQRKNEV